MKSINYLWKDRKRHLGMPISFTKYGLTDDRFLLETGLLNKDYEELLLYRVRDISLKRSFGQRIFGVGTIMLYSSDATTPALQVKNVKKPEQVKELIHVTVEDCKKKYRMRVGEFVGTPGMVDENGDGLPD